MDALRRFGNRNSIRYVELERDGARPDLPGRGLAAFEITRPDKYCDTRPGWCGRRRVRQSVSVACLAIECKRQTSGWRRERCTGRFRRCRPATGYNVLVDGRRALNTDLAPHPNSSRSLSHVRQI